MSATILRALADGAPPTAEALRVLLRGYASTGRDDMRRALEPALAHALAFSADSSSETRSRWLILFAEAAEASDDERLRHAVTDLATQVRSNWTAAGVNAYLFASPLLAHAGVGDALQAAVDELERQVAHTYEPGYGVEGTVDDNVTLAGALLTAFDRTERIPYAMLAEELVQHVRRAFPDSAHAFVDGCELAAVLGRLGALHASAGYREAAVVAPNAHYTSDAARILEALAAEAPGRGLAGAAYALAAGELR